MPLTPDNPGQRLPPPPKRTTLPAIVSDHEAEERRQQRPVTGKGQDQVASGSGNDNGVRLSTDWALAEFAGGMTFTLPQDNGVWALRANYTLNFTATATGPQPINANVEGDSILSLRFPLWCEEGQSVAFLMDIGNDIVVTSSDLTFEVSVAAVPDGTVSAYVYLTATRLSDIG